MLNYKMEEREGKRNGGRDEGLESGEKMEDGVEEWRNRRK